MAAGLQVRAHQARAIALARRPRRPQILAKNGVPPTAVPRETPRTLTGTAVAIDRLSAVGAGCGDDEMRAIEPALVRY